jgi:hypothetical protein
LQLQLNTRKDFEWEKIDRNTFQKRQRELDKKRKAEDKRKRRQAQKVANTDHKSIMTLTKVDADDASTK